MGGPKSIGLDARTNMDFPVKEQPSHRNCSGGGEAILILLGLFSHNDTASF